MKGLLVAILLTGLSILGYLVYRDMAATEAAEAKRQQEVASEQYASYSTLLEKSRELEVEEHRLRLEDYETRFGHAERRRLEAFGIDVQGLGVQMACLLLSHQRCEAMKENWRLLMSPSGYVMLFVRP